MEVRDRMSENTKKNWLLEALETAEVAGAYEFSLRLPLALMKELARYENDIAVFSGPTEFCRTAIREYLDALKKERWRHHERVLDDAKG